MTTLRLGMLVVSWSLALSRASAQNQSTISVALGVAVQPDARLTRGLKLSPVGPTAGAGYHRTHGGVEMGITGLVSWYMHIAADRITSGPGPSSGSDPDGSLALGRVAAELGSNQRETVSWFACVGAVTVMSSPRSGSIASPLGCVGVRWAPFLHGRLNIAYEQFLTPLGETRFQIPVFVAIPLTH